MDQGWMDGWMDQGMDGSGNGWIKEWMDQMEQGMDGSDGTRNGWIGCKHRWNAWLQADIIVEIIGKKFSK